MARSLQVRLDHVSTAAVEIVRASVLGDSEAAPAIQRAAAARICDRSGLREEVSQFVVDRGDRVEVLAVLGYADAEKALERSVQGSVPPLAREVGDCVDQPAWLRGP